MEAVGILQAKVERLKRHTLKMMQQEAEKAERSGEIDDDAMQE